MLYKIFTFIILISLLGCSTKKSKLENALKLSSTNRPELEKVLVHYSNDSSKLKAAKFLIENMPGHFTMTSKQLDELKEIIRHEPKSGYFASKIFDIVYLKFTSREGVTIQEDIKYITSDFLITYIDKAFDYFNYCPWLEDLPFDIFLEYFLPYRFENEKLDYWRDSLSISNETIKSMPYKDNIKHSIQHLKEKNDIKLDSPLTYPELVKKIVNLEIDLYDDCYSIAHQELLRLRSKGIPAAMDFILYYPNRNGYHYWANKISPEFKALNIQDAEERKSAKIYRRTFSHNNILRSYKKEYIPNFFLNPFNKDVTDIYLNTHDFTVPVINNIKQKVFNAYLCVFCNLEWNVVGAGKMRRREAEFYNYGKGIVYLPICFEGDKIKPINYPFILDNKGNTKFLRPNKNKMQDLHLTRKYPFTRNLYDLCDSLRNVKIEATNDSNFNKIDTTLHFITKNFQYKEIDFESKKSYRYWRIKGTTTKLYGFAGFTFFDKNNEIVYGKTDSIYSKIFDGDPLSNTILEKNNAIIIEFDQPVEISRIVCLPRNDGNGVYPNNLYELFYYDLNGWNSLGLKSGTNFYLDYKDIPTNALFWLRNLTNGSEERIFTVENGDIRFW